MQNAAKTNITKKLWPKRQGIVFLTIILILGFTSFSFGQTKYFTTYGSLADSLEKVYGIPAPIILGVAFHESGAGKSQVATLLNNHFGLKGKNDLVKTHNIKSAYKYYATVADSYAGFCKVISSKKYYPTLKGTSNIDTWLTAISNAGYAANAVTWKASILRVIRIYSLDKK